VIVLLVHSAATCVVTVVLLGCKKEQEEKVCQRCQCGGSLQGKKFSKNSQKILKEIACRRGSTPQDRRAFYGAIRSHSQLKRIHEQAQRGKDATFQEQSFLHNFYNYAEEAVAGTIGGGCDSPQFLVEVANRYYPEKY
jgi:hypothetical protein